MDPGTVALTASFIGASAGILGGLSLETFKRYLDKRAAAEVIAASIETNLWLVEKRGHVKMVEGLLAHALNGTPVKIFGMVDDDHTADEIVQKYIDRIGLPVGRHSANVVKFYTIQTGIRVDIAKFKRGEFGEDPRVIANIMQQDLDMWREAELIGRQLIVDLRMTTMQKIRNGLVCLFVWIRQQIG